MKKYSLNSVPTYLLIGLIVSILSLGCEKNRDEDKIGLGLHNYKLQSGSYTFYASSEHYLQTNIKRGDEKFCQVETKISKISREGNILTLEIVKPIDCEVNYEIIWDGEIKESYPMQCNLFVYALPGNCNKMLFGASIETLVINIEEVLKDIDKSTLSDINFTIKDACSYRDVECTGDCAVTVAK
ncbi:MAG: hypothetical protein R2814_12370 [Flavobacteriaceae bacterium]